MILVILLNIRYIKRINKRNFLFFIGIIILFLIIQIYKSCELKPILNTIFYIFASYIFCLSYINKPYKFIINLNITLRLFTLHAFISIFIYFLFHPLIYKLNINGIQYITILNVFYYILPADGFPRIIGLFWEPGVFQLIANFYLFICINNGYKIKRLLWIIIVVVSTISSTGFVLLLLNALYYVKININIKKLKISIILLLLMFLTIIPTVYNTIYNKWTNDMSGMIRQVNTIIGIKLSLAHPFVGVDTNVDKLIKNVEFNRIEEDLWGVNSPMLSTNYGTVAGGFTNGILSLLLVWGIFIGMYFFYLFFKSRFFPSTLFAIYFLLLFILTNMTEALTDTSFFYIFVISTFVLGRRSKIVDLQSKTKGGFQRKNIEQKPYITDLNTV